MQPHKPHLPVGGRLRFFHRKWLQVTSDPAVLDIVKGMHIELNDIPCQHKPPKPLKLSFPEIQAANDQIEKLLAKNAIVPTVREPGDFVSNVFLTPKRDGGYRMILNLKPFNKFVQYHHFKMECLNHILATITPFCWMAIFDFTDAYLTVSIAGIHVKFLKFQWQGQLFMYVVLPFGIASAPRQFTKLLKPILAFIRTKGIIILTYIDDGFTVANTFNECFQNICFIMRTFTSFGFLLNKDKSAPVPSHQVHSLGFYLNSITMNITLPPEKIANAVQMCQAFLVLPDFTVLQLAQLIGTLVSLFPACPLGRLHYRSLERLKVETLHHNRGSYEAICSLNKPCYSDLNWWLHYVPFTAAPISRNNPSFVLYCDSSEYAWGAYLSGVTAQGYYTPEEKNNIIAVKELFAIYYGLRSFSSHFLGSHVLVRSDNVGAVAYVRDMGGMKNVVMDHIAKQIWEFAQEHGFWISISFISGHDNYDADFTSRILSSRTEWTLHQSLFHKLTQIFFQPDIDLFASCLNARVPKYISWIPDPYCFEVDAFSIAWEFSKPYLFPPFSLLYRSLQKILHDKVKMALIVFPLWMTQHWFPRLLHLLTSQIVIIPQEPSLYLPWQTTITPHPLGERLILAAAVISSIPERHTSFLQTLPISLNTESVSLPRGITRSCIKPGFSLPLDGHLIPINQM